jgi:predicted PurR-regulated permease PerM
MKTRIEIDTRTFVRFWLVVIGFVLAIGLVYMARDALVTIGIALFLALALNLPVSYIADRLPSNSRAGATAIAFIVVVTLLSGFVLTVVPPVIEQTARFAENIPETIESLKGQAAPIDSFVERYGLRDQYNDALENTKAQAAHFATNLSASFVDGVGAVLNAAVRTLIILVLTFLMLVEGPMWMQRLWGLYRDSARLERHRALVHRMYRVVSGYVTGQILVASIAATGSAVTVLILSTLFPFPPNLAMPVAAVVFVGGLIPMFGATIGGIIAIVLLALNSFTAAMLFTLYFVVYQQVENNFISPTIQSRTVELSALTVLAAITVGISLFGILGGIISIPVAGCLRILLNHYLEHNRRVRGAKESHVKLAKT